MASYVLKRFRSFLAQSNNFVSMQRELFSAPLSEINILSWQVKFSYSITRDCNERVLNYFRADFCCLSRWSHFKLRCEGNADKICCHGAVVQLRCWEISLFSQEMLKILWKLFSNVKLIWHLSNSLQNFVTN